MKKSLNKQIFVFLLLATFTLTTSIFAWVNISMINQSKGMEGKITDGIGEVNYEVSRNGGEYVVVNKDSNLEDIFYNTAPGEYYTFRLEAINISNQEINIMAEIREVFSKSSLNIPTNIKPTEPITDNYDIRDVYYLEDGLVTIEYRSNITGALIKTETNTLDKISEDEKIVFGQTLNKNRLSNLVKGENDDIVLTPLLKLQPIEKVYIIFTIHFDVQTTNINYMYQSLASSGIYIFGQ